jgi:hypothetical protein
MKPQTVRLYQSRTCSSRTSANSLDALPNLHDKPSFDVLCNALENLAIQPTNWSDNVYQKHDPENVKDVNDYLLSIISNGLKWINNDSGADEMTTDPKEVLWDLASRRMAERCGRSGEFLIIPPPNASL